MKTSNLYLLVSADPKAHRFKMGHSIDPFRRQRELAQEFDLSRSLQFQVDRERARKIETHLHVTFAAHQVDPALIGDCDGRNEWFNMTCFDSVVSYISANNGELRPVEQEMRTVAVSIPTELHRRLRIACAHADTTISEVITGLIEQYTAGSK